MDGLDWSRLEWIKFSQGVHTRIGIFIICYHQALSKVDSTASSTTTTTPHPPTSTAQHQGAAAARADVVGVFFSVWRWRTGGLADCWANGVLSAYIHASILSTCNPYHHHPSTIPPLPRSRQSTAHMPYRDLPSAPYRHHPPPRLLLLHLPTFRRQLKRTNALYCTSCTT